MNHQDLEGNTAAHLAISAPPVNLENPYTNELEDVFEATDLASLATFNLNPGQTLQVGVLVVLLGSVDRDLRNQDGDTPEDLVENPDLRRFIQEPDLFKSWLYLFANSPLDTFLDQSHF